MDSDGFRRSRRATSTTTDLGSSVFLSLGSNDTAAAHLRALTLHPHVAGTKANSLTAGYVHDAFSSLSFPAHITPYSVLLSYPVHRSLSLSAPGRASAAVVTSFALQPWVGTWRRRDGRAGSRGRICSGSPWHQEQGSLMGVRWRFIRCHELCTTFLRFGNQMSLAEYNVQG
ncbi:unnamed protein product [Urochloa humidicola]